LRPHPEANMDLKYLFWLLNAFELFKTYSLQCNSKT
jgi:hypothetical protein